MKFVSMVNSLRVWSAIAVLLIATSSAEASSFKIKEVVKQAIPQVSQQLAKLGSKVKIGAACVGALCVISFAAPAEAANLGDLRSSVDLFKSRGSDSIFISSKKIKSASAAGESSSGVSFNQSIGGGVYHESGDSLGTMRIGVSAEYKNFNGYLTTAFRNNFDTEDIDNIPIKLRAFAGGSGLLINNGEGQLSFGHLSADSRTGGTLMLYDAQAHLLHYNEGPFSVVALGYEYHDGDTRDLSGDEGSDGVRVHGVSLYRAGLNYPLAPYLTKSDAIDINLKLNSAMLVGDIGPVKLGETWQGQLNDWAGDEADLDHMLYHIAGGSINLNFANDRIGLSIGGMVQHSIDGDINAPGQMQGDFDIVNTALAVAGSIVVLPEHDVSLKGYFERYDQSVDANFDGKSYEENSWGTWGRVVVEKQF